MSELHSVVLTVKIDSCVGCLYFCFRIHSQTLLGSLCVPGADPYKMFPRLPCPLDSSQVQPVRMALVRIFWQAEERKKLASFFTGLSASASYSWMWLCLFHGSISYRKPFLSVVPAPTDCPTVSPAAGEPWFQILVTLPLPFDSLA